MILIYMYSVLGMILLGTTARNGIMNTYQRKEDNPMLKNKKR
jgi:hypothetical protein